MGCLGLELLSEALDVPLRQPMVIEPADFLVDVVVLQVPRRKAAGVTKLLDFLFNVLREDAPEHVAQMFVR